MRCLLGLVAMIVLSGVLRAQGENDRSSAPASSQAGAEKQRILWKKLEKRVAEINQGLRGRE